MSFLLASSNPIHHILDKPVGGGEHINMLGKAGITIHMVSLLLAAIITFIILRIAAKRIAVGEESQGTDRFLTKGRVPQIIEVITLYLRDTILRPVLGHETERYLPYLLSLFFSSLLQIKGHKNCLFFF